MQDTESTPARVRQADARDLDALAALLEEIMAHHGVTRPPEDAIRDTLRAILASTSHLSLVAEVAGNIVGTCSLIFSISTWSAGPVCEVQDLIVTARHRGTGVGRLLLEAARDAALDRGCVRLFLYAEPFNLGAHAFYRSLGMEEKTALYFERSLAR
ncbi:MAG TPA: GNAT family N-acetyltransferase [Thermoleophilia bacterium]|nr:GNAT family N-acetyltransferase [Thermoleophilia bacterium]